MTRLGDPEVLDAGTEMMLSEDVLVSWGRGGEGTGRKTGRVSGDRPEAAVSHAATEAGSRR